MYAGARGRGCECAQVRMYAGASVRGRARWPGPIALLAVKGNITTMNESQVFSSPQSGKQVAALLVASRERIAEKALELQLSASPGVWDRYGEAGRAVGKRDMGYHLDYLVEALRFDSPRLFGAYVRWLGELFPSLNLPDHAVGRTLEALGLSIELVISPESAKLPLALIESSQTAEEAALPGFGEAEPLGQDAAAYLRALLSGDRQGGAALVRALYDGGMSLKSIYLDIFQASQREIGRLWQTGVISVAQEHFCTAATQSVIAGLYPLIFGGRKNGLSLVAASVGGELHELGIRMVADFFELEGWSSYFLGANTPQAAIVAALRDRKAQVLCLSASIATGLAEIESIIGVVRDRFSREELKIMVGGGPFNVSPGLWSRVGADGYASDAAAAVDEAARLLA